MQVETGELPLALWCNQQEIKYAASDGHPAKSVTEFHWTALNRKFKL